jgi:hypothetical protein
MDGHCHAHLNWPSALEHRSAAAAEFYPSFRPKSYFLSANTADQVNPKHPPWTLVLSARSSVAPDFDEEPSAPKVDFGFRPKPLFSTALISMVYTHRVGSGMDWMEPGALKIIHIRKACLIGSSRSFMLLAGAVRQDVLQVPPPR